MWGTKLRRRPSAQAAVGIRFLPADTSAAIDGRSILVERQPLTVESRGPGAFRKGDMTRFGIDATRAFLFGEDGRRI